jgi:conjugal transfer pilus assembly protein TraF
MAFRRILTLGIAASTALSPMAMAQQAMITEPTMSTAPTMTGPPADGSGREYCQRQLGHWFYCGNRRPKPTKQPTPPPAASPSEPTKTEYEEKVIEFNRRYEALRAKIAIDPTEEDVVELMRMHAWIVERGALASDLMQRALWTNPDLDYTLRVPLNDQGGTAAFRQAQFSERRDHMSVVRERYGVFFFYMSTCPHCHRMAPILRRWADEYGIEVRAVSMDGGPIPGFPDARADNGLFERFGLAGRPVPALILYDTKSRKVQPISFGSIPQDELERRIFTLTATQPGQNY